MEEIEVKLNRVRKASRFFKFLMGLGMALMSLVFMLVVAVFLTEGFENDEMTISFSGVIVPMESLGTTSLIWAAFATVVLLAMLFMIMLQMYRLFDSFSRGQIYTRENVAHIKTTGLLIIFVWVGSWLAESVLSSLARADGVILEGSTTVDFSYFIIGFLIVTIAWVLDVGASIQEENERTI